MRTILAGVVLAVLVAVPALADNDLGSDLGTILGNALQSVNVFPATVSPTPLISAPTATPQDTNSGAMPFQDFKNLTNADLDPATNDF